jgi:hypothetical protein
MINGGADIYEYGFKQVLSATTMYAENRSR